MRASLKLFITNMSQSQSFILEMVSIWSDLKRRTAFWNLDMSSLKLEVDPRDSMNSFQETIELTKRSLLGTWSTTTRVLNGLLTNWFKETTSIHQTRMLHITSLLKGPSALLERQLLLVSPQRVETNLPQTLKVTDHKPWLLQTEMESHQTDKVWTKKEFDIYWDFKKLNEHNFIILNHSY